MVELLVAMVILVIAFGLVTYLYTRAARIRRIVVVNSELQQALSQMMDTLTYGERNSWGLIDATAIETGLDAFTLSETTVLVASKGPYTMTARISSGTNTESTLTVDWGGGDIMLDPEEKIGLLLYESPYQSMFEYYDSGGNRLDMPLLEADAKKVTFVKITLWARSTDPAFRKAPPVPFMTGVRLNNSPSR